MAQQHFGDTDPISAEEAMEFAGQALDKAKAYVDDSASNVDNYIATHEDVEYWFNFYMNQG